MKTIIFLFTLSYCSTGFETEWYDDSWKQNLSRYALDVFSRHIELSPFQREGVILYLQRNFYLSDTQTQSNRIARQIIMLIIYWNKNRYSDEWWMHQLKLTEEGNQIEFRKYEWKNIDLIGNRSETFRLSI